METRKKWKCENCGYTFESEAVPEKCSACGESCSFLDVTSYIPDVVDGIDNRIG